MATTWQGSEKSVEYSLEEEEEDAAAGGVQRRNVHQKVIRQNYADDLSVAKKFSTPSGYRLLGISSRLVSPANKFGEQSETYIKEDAWTTTTTTTTT